MASRQAVSLPEKSLNSLSGIGAALGYPHRVDGSVSRIHTWAKAIVIKPGDYHPPVLVSASE
jgi:hypothetical protein